MKKNRSKVKIEKRKQELGKRRKKKLPLQSTKGKLKKKLLRILLKRNQMKKFKKVLKNQVKSYISHLTIQNRRKKKSWRLLIFRRTSQKRHMKEQRKKSCWNQKTMKKRHPFLKMRAFKKQQKTWLFTKARGMNEGGKLICESGIFLTSACYNCTRWLS